MASATAAIEAKTIMRVASKETVSGSESEAAA